MRRGGAAGGEEWRTGGKERLCDDKGRHGDEEWRGGRDSEENQERGARSQHGLERLTLLSLPRSGGLIRGDGSRPPPIIHSHQVGGIRSGGDEREGETQETHKKRGDNERERRIRERVRRVKRERRLMRERDERRDETRETRHERGHTRGHTREDARERKHEREQM